MKKLFKEELKKLFSKADFNWTKSGTTEISQGVGMVLIHISRYTKEGINFFINVRLHQQAEAFGLDIGWSGNKDIPEPDYSNPSYFDFHGQAKNLAENMISLPLLTEGNDRLWYIVSPEEFINNPMLLIERYDEKSIHSRVNTCFVEALNMINQKGIPYLESAKCTFTNEKPTSDGT